VTKACSLAIETVRDLRRQQIVRAARRIVAEEGLDALTIGTLESSLAFSRGVITYHFANKDEIVVAVLESAIEEIDRATRAEVREHSSAIEKICGVLRATIEGFVGHPEATRILISFWGRIPSSPEIQRINARLYASYRKEAVRLVRAGRKAGEIGDVAPEAVAALLVGIVIGVATQAYFDHEAIDVEKVIVEAQHTVVARLRP
jgi:AcrR family transcriptional regulator